MNTIKLSIFALFFSATALISCKKAAGPGGTSSITGNLNGETINGAGKSPVSEVTTIICTHANGVDGSILDNSDYFLLNTPDNGTNYYVWYENTNWPGQDPGLSGRTGIKVTYSNSQSNVMIAQNTAAAIQAAASTDFLVTVFNDIVTVENTATGEVTDADDVNTPFVVDISRQGKGATSGGGSNGIHPIADERVYLIYGEEDFYSESVRTDANGNYQFKGLARGSYTIYAFSTILNSSFDAKEMKTVKVQIDKNKTVVQAPQLSIVQ